MSDEFCCDTADPGHSLRSTLLICFQRFFYLIFFSNRFTFSVLELEGGFDFVEIGDYNFDERSSINTIDTTGSECGFMSSDYSYQGEDYGYDGFVVQVNVIP